MPGERAISGGFCDWNGGIACPTEAGVRDEFRDVGAGRCCLDCNGEWALGHPRGVCVGVVLVVVMAIERRPAGGRRVSGRDQGLENFIAERR